MGEAEAVSGIKMLGALGSGLLWVLENIGLSVYNFFYALTHPQLWLDWSDKQAIMRFVYYGGSTELFFVVFTIFLLMTAVGLRYRSVMWGYVRGLEWLGNSVGRFFAWAGLLMVLQQVLIVIMQRIFTRPDIVIGFGVPLQFDISWYAEELKLYNAFIVALCVSYTFIQGGHVRVDLIYSKVSFRTKKLIDMFGSMFFIMPMAVITWLYAWFFMWRHLIVPKPSASDKIELLLRKAKLLRWNVETIGFSPNGFTAYFLFKILLVAFTVLIFLQAMAFFYRSLLEYLEGEESADKYLDKDSLGDGEEAYEGTH